MAAEAHAQEYTVPVEIAGVSYDTTVRLTGTGPVPLMIAGHAPIYERLLRKLPELDRMFTFITPSLYWCQGTSLVKDMPAEAIASLALSDLADHLEQIRAGLAAQNLLDDTDGKIALYGHSGFATIAFDFARLYQNSALFVVADGALPYLNARWMQEKALYLEGNASEARASALAAIDSPAPLDMFTTFEAYVKAYHESNPVVWYDYEKDYRQEVWGDTKLNMPMMQAFFLSILAGYDCRSIMDNITCPIHMGLGIYDGNIPCYLWTDSPLEEPAKGSSENPCFQGGGVGFFDRGNRDYYLYTQSGHWPMVEEPAHYVRTLCEFITKKTDLTALNTMVANILAESDTPVTTAANTM